MAKKQEESIEQLDKALTEIDVLDHSDKDIFRVDSETFRFQKVEFKLIEDYKEAFDIEMMEDRFTDYLLKYDYIVGDIGYDKLRLRGFYEDHRKGVPLDMKISNLEDYLVEYCNFGCPYFVFERVEKKKNDPESYFKRNKKTSHNKNKKQANQHKQKNTPKQTNKNRNQKKRKPQNKQKHQNSEKKKDFQVVKKEESQTKKTQNNEAQQSSQSQQTKKNDDKKQFKIRKKTDE